MYGNISKTCCTRFVDRFWVGGRVPLLNVSFGLILSICSCWCFYCKDGSTQSVSTGILVGSCSRCACCLHELVICLCGAVKKMKNCTHVLVHMFVLDHRASSWLDAFLFLWKQCKKLFLFVFFGEFVSYFAMQCVRIDRNCDWKVGATSLYVYLFELEHFCISAWTSLFFAFFMIWFIEAECVWPIWGVVQSNFLASHLTPRETIATSSVTQGVEPAHDTATCHYGNRSACCQVASGTFGQNKNCVCVS